MKSLFAPAVKTMNRLSYPGKFALVGLLAVIAVSALLIPLSLHLFEEIKVTQRELTATALMQPINRQIQLTQQHRGISAAFLSGATDMQEKMLNKRAEVNRAITEVDQVEMRYSTQLQTGPEWRAIHADWDRLTSHLSEMSTAETLAAHGQLIGRLLEFQTEVADAGGLTLDNELETFYLAEVLFKKLPDMLERLGKLRAKGTGILVKKKLTEADHLDIKAQHFLLKTTLLGLKHDLTKVGRYAPAIKARLDPFSMELETTTIAAMGMLETDILSERFSIAPQTFFDQFTQTMDIGYRELFDTLFPTLNQMLEARIATLRFRVYLQTGLTIGLLLLLGYFSIGAYYAIMESIHKLSAGAVRYSEGDFAASIRLEGQDELNRVAESINAMAASLGTLIGESRTISAELNEALVAARQAEQTKDAFLANMSHELRTPLNAVIGMASLARDTCTEVTPRDYLDKIMVAGKSLSRIINDLLDLSKIAAGHMEFESTAFSLRGVLERTKSVMVHRAIEKGLILVDRIDPDVPDVLQGDPMRIEQIILNLIGNAIKFTASGHVKVLVSQVGIESDRVALRIDVEDSGIGMREEDLNRLFKPFAQADASVSRKFGGTGLGLAISKRLAEMMNGDITVTSREGSGTTFSVTLRLGLGSEAELAEGQLAKDEALKTRYQDVRVLVVDDQPFNREIAEALLANVGIAATMAENGKDALDILVRAGPGAFDLVLMDVQMPIMDGLTATRELCKREELAPLPIIGMTAHTMQHEIKKGAESGMVDHIGKPFDNARFYATLAKWISPDKHVRAAQTALDRSASQAIHGIYDLPGVDVRAAILRFGGKEERYRHWLMDFVTTAGTVPEIVMQAIVAQRLDEAAQIIHAFKGRVGTLGFGALHEFVEKLEAELRRGAPVEEQLSELEHSIHRMREDLAKALGFLAAAQDGHGVGLEKVTWTEDLSVGDADLDRDHQHLAHTVNRIADFHQVRSNEAAEGIRKALSDLFDYSLHHFSAEEAYMKRLGYTGLDAHRKSHREFLEKLTAFNRAAADGVLDTAWLHRYLLDWLMQHILCKDLQYGQYAEQCKQRC